jgi:hypothetical protein
MNEKDLKSLAVDIVGGKVFTSRHIRENSPERWADTVRMVFMVLALSNQEQLDNIVDRIGESGIVYEYYDKAMTRSINGYPIFISMNIIGSEDAEKLDKYVKELQDKQKEFLEGENEDEKLDK